MKIKNTLITGLVAISSQLSHASQNDIVVPVSDLENFGISPTIVHQMFFEQYNMSLNWSEYLKVSKEDEGKSIRFETFDHYSTVVPIDSAHGVFNKDSGM